VSSDTAFTPTTAEDFRKNRYVQVTCRSGLKIECRRIPPDDAWRRGLNPMPLVRAAQRILRPHESGDEAELREEFDRLLKLEAPSVADRERMEAIREDVRQRDRQTALGFRDAAGRIAALAARCPEIAHPEINADRASAENVIPASDLTDAELWDLYVAVIGVPRFGGTEAEAETFRAGPRPAAADASHDEQGVRAETEQLAPPAGVDLVGG
jgi:hypothetical protein